ncbi:WD40-repeat-containing domain protein [Cantharellus anzutake]|uniref:WD40-repeat-containing domain protein n=1 Tax=Cantharellus anzutake TaxID=1750568 RepID=UPI00190456D6|nr:WD40-repeat-containing domain protein [Cantharellus anzutake]KAF8317749.1 WD40-repeat-containing domain protein [Cantharellus anzutake]
MENNGVSFESLVDDVDYSLGGQSSERARAESRALLEELDRRKGARSLAVPTDDAKVRVRLREIGQPITLFGERAPDRRDRLKHHLSQMMVADGELAEDEESEGSKSDEEEEFWTAGGKDLLEARRKIAELSLPRARARLAHQRIESKLPLSRTIDTRKEVISQLKTFSQLGSQIGDERCISQARFSPDGKTLATGSWSGHIKLWDIPNCSQKTHFQGHTDRVGGIAWHPKATVSLSPETVNLASGGGDKSVLLWSLTLDKPLSKLRGHEDRVVRMAFHPSGLFIASASFDGTWRLWDICREYPVEILRQEGHSKEVYAVQFQDDGALAASGGLDGIGRVWDLRTGRTAMVLDGHAQGIFGIDFSPNGFQIATGSGDDTIRIWDMRSLKALHTVPAHKSTVSDVRFYRQLVNPYYNILDPIRVQHLQGNPYELITNGIYLVSSGYDGLVKIWSADDWQLVKAIPTDAGKVMSVDISLGGEYIASGSWNRSFQLFAQE